MITRHKMNGPRQTNGDLGLLWRSQKWRLPSNEPVFKHFLKKKKKRRETHWERSAVLIEGGS